MSEQTVTAETLIAAPAERVAAAPLHFSREHIGEHPGQIEAAVQAARRADAAEP